MSQYADDTTLILANNYSITRTFNLINVFKRGSGLRLNSKKKEGLWNGSYAGRTSGPVNITWVADKLKILGVYLGNANLEQANWADRVTKLETCFVLQLAGDNWALSTKEEMSPADKRKICSCKR